MWNYKVVMASAKGAVSGILWALKLGQTKLLQYSHYHMTYLSLPKPIKTPIEIMVKWGKWCPKLSTCPKNFCLSRDVMPHIIKNVQVMWEIYTDGMNCTDNFHSTVCGGSTVCFAWNVWLPFRSEANDAQKLPSGFSYHKLEEGKWGHHMVKRTQFFSISLVWQLEDPFWHKQKPHPSSWN